MIHGLRSLRALSPVALAVVGLLACGPKGEPKQAQLPDVTGDDDKDTPSSSGGASSGGGMGSDTGPSSPSGPVGKAEKGEAPNANGIGPLLEGMRWGASHKDVLKALTESGGIVHKDYDERLGKASVGPQMKAIEAEREDAKAAITRSYVEFKDNPTGYDSSGIHGEYTYKNKEALLWAERKGKRRYYFFLNDRLWKMYDEVPLADGGAYGASYADAQSKLGATMGGPGRVQQPDAKKGIERPTTDWKDGTTHLRLVDRSGERKVGIVVEEISTMTALPQLRANKAEDPMAIDPTIQAVTGSGPSDPNATAKPEPAGKKPAPKKK